MERIDINNLSDNIVNQISKIEQLTDNKVEIYSDFSDHQFLTLDQASHETKHNKITVTITNEKYSEFVLLHELYHVELENSGEPLISCAVTSGDRDVDGRIISTANSLFESLEHSLVVQKQIDDGSYTDEIKKEYLKGIDHALNPNVQLDPDNMRFYRSLIIFDAIIFGQHSEDSDWKLNFPVSFKVASKLVKQVEDNDLTKPFQFRRALINVLEEYNDLIISRGYESMHYHEFLNVTPIVSERQLRLNLNQTYNIKHSAFKNRSTGDDAFALIAINDGQSVATLNFDSTKVNPEFYKAYYQRTLKETFAKNGIKYQLR
ncbi:hypothetical protein M5C72_10765 [Companilactobacillus allii]|uniref:IpaB/EvcA family protein n=1 Tax=Companilactobacillus allii TaxID=1847728 RepID=A0A1P8Q044_9LACO|nr:hypothetical protein [Companilactobacillus allii]APX71238.1 hypothetical protein BTM29_01135 [Companilactobacillus allii]USQ68319.1 hypothetical protein M5C72_10765 [Companilactobacillus allii]